MIGSFQETRCRAGERGSWIPWEIPSAGSGGEVSDIFEFDQMKPSLISEVAPFATRVNYNFSTCCKEPKEPRFKTDIQQMIGFGEVIGAKDVKTM